MESALESARGGATVAIKSTATRPALVELTVLANTGKETPADVQVQEIVA